MKILLPFFILLLGISACQNKASSPALDALEYELEKVKKELAFAQANQSVSQAGALVHIVYFDLKETLSTEERTAFIKELGRLEDIPQVKNFMQGGFKDLKDQRALSQYEWVIKMTLKDQATYDIYQSSEIHQDVKSKLGPYLAKAPATYDFLIE